MQSYLGRFKRPVTLGAPRILQMANQSSPKYPQRRGNHIINKLFNRAGKSQDEGGTGRRSDTYRQLKQLRDLLKGGQITKEEYEVIKFELLHR